MGGIYQLIFFLAVALLAIVITVFVLAVSLLGRAVRLSAQEQIEAEEKRKKDTENEIKKIQDKLEKAKAAARVDVEDLSRSLRDLESRDTRHKWKLRWIKIKPKLLTASWGALIPGALFLISAIFIALALNLPAGTATASLYMWISLVALGVGICFVCLTLKVIQGVAITSEETAFVRQKDMFKAALLEHEMEKKPEFLLTFVDKQFPLHIHANSETSLLARLNLLKGEFAEGVWVYFGLPPGFDFPGEDASTLPPYHDYPNYTYMVWGLKDVLRGLDYWKNISIKAPPAPGSFKMIYYTFSRGYWTITPIELEIIVD